MNSPLKQLGNIPVTAAALESLFPNIRGGNQKIRLLERDKQVIRLKRGLYVCSPNVTGIALSTELIANHLYTPSYVSMSSALRYYGLIPEEVYVMQSMTLKHPRDFDTPIGRFEYTYISKDAFSVGLSSIKKNEYAFVIATPEKALCDLVANSPGSKSSLSQRCGSLFGGRYQNGVERFQTNESQYFGRICENRQKS